MSGGTNGLHGTSGTPLQMQSNLNIWYDLIPEMKHLQVTTGMS